MSRVTSHMSSVTCHIFFDFSIYFEIFFFDKVLKLIGVITYHNIIVKKNLHLLAFLGFFLQCLLLKAEILIKAALPLQYGLR